MFNLCYTKYNFLYKWNLLKFLIICIFLFINFSNIYIINHLFFKINIMVLKSALKLLIELD